MKYFFLSDGWVIGRIWELGGLWNERVWRRKPNLQQLPLTIQEKGETLWLYQVEDAVLMVEVKPGDTVASSSPSIGQVVLKRLMTAEQAMELICAAESVAKGTLPPAPVE